MGQWTKERHDRLRAHVDGTRLSGGAFDVSEDDAADMLAEIERLTAGWEESKAMHAALAREIEKRATETFGRTAPMTEERAREVATRWDGPRRYRSDDRDIRDLDLVVLPPDGNGDWYVGVVPHGDKFSRYTVRVTTSGTPHGQRDVCIAVADLYRAMGGEDITASVPALSAARGGDVSAVEVPHPDAGGRCRWCGRRVYNCPDPCACDPADPPATPTPEPAADGVVVRPDARPKLDAVRAIVEAYYQDEHAEGRPAASWVLEQVRETIGGAK